MRVACVAPETPATCALARIVGSGREVTSLRREQLGDVRRAHRGRSAGTERDVLDRRPRCLNAPLVDAADGRVVAHAARPLERQVLGERQIRQQRHRDLGVRLGDVVLALRAADRVVEQEASRGDRILDLVALFLAIFGADGDADRAGRHVEQRSGQVHACDQLARLTLGDRAGVGPVDRRLRRAIDQVPRLAAQTAPHSVVTRGLAVHQSDVGRGQQLLNIRHVVRGGRAFELAVLNVRVPGEPLAEHVEVALQARDCAIAVARHERVTAAELFPELANVHHRRARESETRCRPLRAQLGSQRRASVEERVIAAHLDRQRAAARRVGERGLEDRVAVHFRERQIGEGRDVVRQVVVEISACDAPVQSALQRVVRGGVEQVRVLTGRLHRSSPAVGRIHVHLRAVQRDRH
jgi:hypothetical protein